MPVTRVWISNHGSWDGPVKPPAVVPRPPVPSMSIDAHRLWLRQRIPVDVPLGVRVVHDQIALRKLGVWMSGLELGFLAPLTERQRRFVEVVGGRASPATEFERLWLAFMRRRFADRAKVCVCDRPLQKCCQYDTGWSFRGERICTSCGWTIDGRVDGPDDREWLRVASDALREAPWFVGILRDALLSGCPDAES
jgi:uncharacterized protein YifE (UPF0438 family)